VKRLVAQELTLSFVPDAEQRLWRTVMRRKYQSRATAFSCATDWNRCWKKRTSSCSAWSPIYWAPAPDACCRALADGETDPITLASLAAQRLRATAAILYGLLGRLSAAAPAASFN
jgi:hypothetical protein